MSIVPTDYRVFGYNQPVGGLSKSLRDLAGVGPHLAEDLSSLGVHTVGQLAKRDPDKLYLSLCRKAGVRQDPCVLDAFRCAVAQARDTALPPEQRNWWWWSRERKKGALAPVPQTRS